MKNSFKKAFEGRTVLVTGHTGFKGSWLTIWLTNLGAKVVGISLEEPPSVPSNFELTHVADKIVDIRGDVRDLDLIVDTINEHKPSVVFHLAAQPILLRSYEEPKLTFDTNAGGTVNVLEAIRLTDSVEAYVSITTDKVYKNNEWVWGYRETDELGDKDPYAASKAMAELAIESYRRSYFDQATPDRKTTAIASTRAGNVIGGGDFADFRLVPDSMKALMEGEPIGVRNPNSVRPWQLVLEPLSGYLWLAVKLLEEPTAGFDKAWNFGPLSSEGMTVGKIADYVVDMWGDGSWEHTGSKEEAKKESNLLMLDWTAAQNYLGWRPVYGYQDTLAQVVEWFKEYKQQKDADPDSINMYETCVKQIDAYTKSARELGIKWATPGKS